MATPEGFTLLEDHGEFVRSVGPFHVREADGVVGVQVEDRHLNAGGTAMGGFLATLVDVAIGHAVRVDTDDGVTAATVSLTTDYLRPGPAGVWLQAQTEIEQLGGRLAFVDCSVRDGEQEVVRARAVFAISSKD